MKTIQAGPVQELQTQLAEDVDAHFERLMLAYQGPLYAFAWRLSGNPQDAEEVVQDAFVRAYRALKGYPGERIRELALRPWLYQIALNVFRNRVRGRRLETVPMDPAPGDDDYQELSDYGQDSPETAAVESEVRGELAALLAALPERYRAAVILRFVQGLSYAEMAEVLGQPVGTIKANVHRGIRWLREAVPAAESLR